MGKSIIYDVFVLAGQSNAEGNGLAPKELAKSFDDVFLLNDKNPAWVNPNNILENGPEFIITLPTECEIVPYKERLVGNDQIAINFMRTFCEDYIANKLLKKNHKILIVNAPIGGTGFALKQWGDNCPCTIRLDNMLDYLKHSPFRCEFKGILWHQGEHDSFENADYSFEKRYSFYKRSFKSLMESIRFRTSGHTVPIIAGEFCRNWSEDKENKDKCQAVYRATRDVLLFLGNSDYVTSEGLTSNDQEIHNGDPIHFSYNSQLELGHRYFEKYKYVLKHIKLKKAAHFFRLFR